MKLSDEQFAAIARSVAEPRRFAILKQIAACRQCTPCAAVIEKSGVSPATVSHHIKELEDAGLITARREGKFSLLSLKREVWDAYLDRLRRL